MKKSIVLLLILGCNGAVIAEDAIMLQPDNYLEKSINLDTPNPELLERGVQKLNNNGVILQNSISPVMGVNYNSTSIPSERKIEEKTQPDE